MKKERYYKCHECNSMITYSEILDECSNGGVGMCYCKFDEGRILIPYKRINKKEYVKNHPSKMGGMKMPRFVWFLSMIRIPLVVQTTHHRRVEF